MSGVHSKNKNELIVFVDSQCVVCNGLVEWILARDKKKLFQFAGLNSERFKALKENQNLTDIPDSVVFYKQGKVYFKSRAVLHIFQNFGFPWSSIHSIGQWLPERWSDALYDWVAQNRYGWFGQTEEDFCKMPAPEHKGRFLR
ncbi:MAG TPA: DCC1-like thiol-disulfide oxidoreductase family protein [Saprospiraceae bacterium]|nr:DCC1-like thiol-disulfide oxidoreductase family protein [Saprospiraceae bacterium]